MTHRTPDRAARGRLGEALAAWFLTRRGYHVVERNARLGRWEIDLVVERGEWLVFVEVKYRGGRSWGGAGRALGGPQRQRLARAAALYAARHEGRGLRFDAVTVEEDERRLVLEHHTDVLGAAGDLR